MTGNSAEKKKKAKKIKFGDAAPSSGESSAVTPTNTVSDGSEQPNKEDGENKSGEDMDQVMMILMIVLIVIIVFVLLVALECGCAFYNAAKLKRAKYEKDKKDAMARAISQKDDDLDEVMDMEDKEMENNKME